MAKCVDMGRDEGSEPVESSHIPKVDITSQSTAQRASCNKHATDIHAMSIYGATAVCQTLS